MGTGNMPRFPEEKQGHQQPDTIMSGIRNQQAKLVGQCWNMTGYAIDFGLEIRVACLDALIACLDALIALG